MYGKSIAVDGIIILLTVIVYFDPKFFFFKLCTGDMATWCLFFVKNSDNKNISARILFAMSGAQPSDGGIWWQRSSSVAEILCAIV